MRMGDNMRMRILGELLFLLESICCGCSLGALSEPRCNLCSVIVVLPKHLFYFSIYSQLSLSRNPRDSEILRDLRISTYQISRIEEKINRTTTFHKMNMIFDSCS